MATPAQTYIQLDLDFILGVYRPLLRTMEAAVILHDCSDQHVVNLLDEGKLRGYDLRGSAESKRTLRILRYTAEHMALRPEMALRHIPMADLLPIQRPTFQRGELARWFGVSETTVGEWPLSGPRTDRRSIYFRDSVIKFLEYREIQN